MLKLFQQAEYITICYCKDVVLKTGYSYRNSAEKVRHYVHYIIIYMILTFIFSYLYNNDISFETKGMIPPTLYYMYRLYYNLDPVIGGRKFKRQVKKLKQREIKLEKKSKKNRFKPKFRPKRAKSLYKRSYDMYSRGFGGGTLDKYIYI